MAQAPGEQFLLERLRKIEGLPPSERPYDAACFLESYRLQVEVAEALPLPTKESVGTPGPEPWEASLALLKMLKAYYVADFGFTHLKKSYARLTLQVLPYLPMPICTTHFHGPAPAMQQLLDHWADDSLLTLLRVICVGWVLRTTAHPKLAACVSRLLAKAAKRLTGPNSAAVYAEQLVGLQTGGQQALMTLNQLAYMALMFQYDAVSLLSEAAQKAGDHKEVAMVQAALQGISERMLVVLPDEPRVYLHLTLHEYEANEKSRWLKRALEASIARGSDWHTVGIASQAAMLTAGSFQSVGAASGSKPGQQCPTRAATAGEVQQLLSLARASLRRIHSLLPTGFAATAKLQLQQAEACCAPLTGQSTKEPCSLHELSARWANAYKQCCNTCGERSVSLKLCSGCKAVGYCSVECQRAHWRQHKPACIAARQSKAPAEAGQDC